MEKRLALADDLSITLLPAEGTGFTTLPLRKGARIAARALVLSPNGASAIHEIPAGLVISEFYLFTGERLVRHLFDADEEGSPLRPGVFIAWGGGAPNENATRLTKMGRNTGSEVGGTAIVVRYEDGAVGDLDDAELLWLTACAGGFGFEPAAA